MSGFLTPPTFNPPVYGISLGTDGQVLTMVGGIPMFEDAGGGGGGGIGAYLEDAPAAGVHNNYDPAGFGPTIGRVDIDTSAGDVELTGWLAGSDAQLLIVTNIGPNNLILDPFDAGSLPANQFRLPGQMYVSPQYEPMWLCYYGGSVNKWCMA